MQLRYATDTPALLYYLSAVTASAGFAIYGMSPDYDREPVRRYRRKSFHNLKQKAVNWAFALSTLPAENRCCTRTCRKCSHKRQNPWAIAHP